MHVKQLKLCAPTVKSKELNICTVMQFFERNCQTPVNLTKFHQASPTCCKCPCPFIRTVGAMTLMQACT